MGNKSKIMLYVYRYTVWLLHYYYIKFTCCFYFLINAGEAAKNCRRIYVNVNVESKQIELQIGL